MPIKQKHILILTPGFPKDENDFNCIPPLQEFLQKFQSTYSSVKISVIAFQYPSLNNPYVWKLINVIPLGGMDSKIKKPLIWLNALRQAQRINKLVQVDCIHSLWLGESAMIGNILSKKLGCKHICTLMGQDVKASNRYLKWLKNSSTKFISLSKNQSELFQKLTKKNVTEIIHWGIDDQKIIIQERDIDLLGVGSLIPLKNYSLFIRIVEEIVTGNPSLKCKLVGSGPESSELISIAETKRLSKNIEFTGMLSRQEIFKLMQRSKILLHPSKFEGSGFVFAEALANGMNIISFNVGYAQENPKWFIAKNDEDFIGITRSLLSRKLNFDPANLFPLQETVSRYARLYDSVSN
jgi:glycosyltransferase involved in cell wall biosynthesis